MVPVITKSKIIVTKGMSGIALINPKQMARATQGVLKGVAVVKSNKPFGTLVINFTKDEHLLPNIMIIDKARNIPLQLT